MIDLITGHQGVPHISAEQISAIQRAEIGISANNTVVRLSGGALSSVGLELTISEGYWRVHGYDMQFDEAEGVVFDPTEAGYSRIDQLYIEILQDISSGVQRAELIVIQGEPSTTTPTAPLAPTAPESSVDLLIEAVAVATITVSEGAMNMTDLTIAYEAVDSAELEEIRSSAQSAYDLAGEAKTDAESAQDTADSALGNANTALDMIESDDDAYKTNRGYEVGDKVIQNNKLYKCITPCTAGTWTVNESCFEETTITEELTSLNSSLTAMPKLKLRTGSGVTNATSNLDLGTTYSNEYVIACFVYSASGSLMATPYIQTTTLKNFARVLFADGTTFAGQTANYTVIYCDPSDFS